jgi:hypothetical protein
MYEGNIVNLLALLLADHLNLGGQKREITQSGLFLLPDLLNIA